MILFLSWVSLKSRGRRPVMYTFVTLFLFLIIRAEHSRLFEISFGLFSSMLLVLQWITICLKRVEILVFSLAIISFPLCLSVYHNLMCPSRKMNSIPLYIWRVLGLISRQVIPSVCFCLHLMLTYVVGVIYAIPFYKIVQRVLMFATVRSRNLTVRGHSLVRVSIWYRSLWSVVLLSCFWCFNEIFDAVELEKTLRNFENLNSRESRWKKASPLMIYLC